ncbi:33605_t:CDS:2 [Gigaspora margarita]|uniref:33605_t:CDS:1 n=1 Tax=Gigaspora margarita TaxID=4874 RepID=A0ABM8VXC5_GIGMA|nr:33605_t:CDS:2 [Gigaspora margarita]
MTFSHGYRYVEGGIDFEKLNDPNAYDPKKCYPQSKLANILFTDELNIRYFEGEQVYANSLHPGNNKKINQLVLLIITSENPCHWAQASAIKSQSFWSRLCK